MKRRTLFYTSCIATTSNNISSLHFVTILTHTIVCSHFFFSETKYCYSRSDVRSQLAPFSAIPRSWTWKRAKFTNFKNSHKINKNSYNDNFFAVAIRGKRKFIVAEKILGVSGTLRMCYFPWITEDQNNAILM